MSWVAHVWPPIPTGIAGLAGGHRVALTLAAAVAIGSLTYAIFEYVLVARQPWWLVITLTFSGGAAPVMLFAAMTNPAQVLALALMAMALPGFLQFAWRGRTEGGFRAGLLFGMAVACALWVVIFAVALAAAGALIARRRVPGRPWVGSASALVLTFPTVIALACWCFLEWRFAGSVFGAWRNVGIGGSSGTTATAGLLSSAGPPLLVAVALGAPLYLVVGVVVARRSLVALAAYALPVAAVIVVLALGFPVMAGMSVLVLTTVAAMSVPAGTRAGPCVTISVTAVAQWTAGLVVLLGV